jgi:hypothetical protein
VEIVNLNAAVMKSKISKPLLDVRPGSDELVWLVLHQDVKLQGQVSHGSTLLHRRRMWAGNGAIAKPTTIGARGSERRSARFISVAAVQVGSLPWTTNGGEKSGERLGRKMRPNRCSRTSPALKPGGTRPIAGCCWRP